MRFLRALLITIVTGLILFGYSTPAFAQAEWTLQVNGDVNNTLTLTMDQLETMPTASVQADIYCYGVFVTGGNWTGVKLSQILETAGLDPQAQSVAFTAEDGYTVTIPLTIAMSEDVIIAYQMNAQPLSEGLRLVLPGANGNVWIAMITQITVTTSTSAIPPLSEPIPNLNEQSPSALTKPTPIPTPTPTPTPTPNNQTVTQPAKVPTDSQSQHQQGSSTLSLLAKYAYPLAIAAVTAATIAAVTGYYMRKRRKQA
jgi:DMSO/TMAO reductase YedYZ molybdopterin-dependent catalytic subunit